MLLNIWQTGIVKFSMLIIIMHLLTVLGGGMQLACNPRQLSKGQLSPIFAVSKGHGHVQRFKMSETIHKHSWNTFGQISIMISYSTITMST